MIHDRNSIADAMEKAFQALAAKISSYSPEEFTSAPEGKWTPGQHLEHLLRTTTPVNLALKVPKFYLRFQFGKPTRKSRKFHELVQRYEERLADGGQAPERFSPPTVKPERQAKLVKSFLREGKKLNKRLLKWPEAKLDAYILPHPLLGKVTVREMLFFTLHHTRHHLKSLEENY